MNRSLTDEQVRQIRTRRAAGEASGALALEFGVRSTLISRVVYGYVYPTVGGPLMPRRNNSTPTPPRKPARVSGPCTLHQYAPLKTSVYAERRRLFESTVRPLAQGERLCVTCETRKCIEIGHLVVMPSTDAVSNETVATLRASYHERETTFRELAEEFGLTPYFARKIATEAQFDGCGVPAVPVRRRT
jgi:Flp pilus assembly pilin Flp